MTEATGNRRTSMRATDKPFNIEKKLVYEAYKAVKSNGGAAGVDGQTIEQFEADLKSNLYKIWNRMSSGSYFPPPVRAVSIPKKHPWHRRSKVGQVGRRAWIHSPLPEKPNGMHWRRYSRLYIRAAGRV